MKTTNRAFGWCTGLLMAVSLHTQTVRAQLLISIDMDTVTAGIQSTRSANPGDVFTAGVVFDLAGQPAGLSSYGVSVQFDNTKLSLEGSPAAIELLPLGFSFFNLTTGVASETNDIGGGLGQVSTFEAATFASGPTNGTFTAGTITFKVITPLPAGGANVVPGLFNVGIDGLFDNSSASIAGVVFSPGSLVPEPSDYAITTGGLLLAGALIRQLRKAR